jgi:hypothetical protein
VHLFTLPSPGIVPVIGPPSASFSYKIDEIQIGS